MLRRTRGVQDVELEFEDIYQASEAVSVTLWLCSGSISNTSKVRAAAPCHRLGVEPIVEGISDWHLRQIGCFAFEVGRG